MRFIFVTRCAGNKASFGLNWGGWESLTKKFEFTENLHEFKRIRVVILKKKFQNHNKLKCLVKIVISEIDPPTITVGRVHENDIRLGEVLNFYQIQARSARLWRYGL